MTNEQILKEAIEKAVKGGYKMPEWLELEYDYVMSEDFIASFLNTIVFSSSFAKAFWGEEEYKPTQCCEGDRVTYGKRKVKEGWEYHIQQMVLEPKPLKYLEKFL